MKLQVALHRAGAQTGNLLWFQARFFCAPGTSDGCGCGSLVYFPQRTAFIYNSTGGNKSWAAMFLCHLRADMGTSGLDDLKRHLCGEQPWGRKSGPLEIHEWLSLLPGQDRITGSLRGVVIDSYCPLKCIWSYWSGRGVPQSNKWFSQGQVHWQDSGCVEPCNLHKCGKPKCIIWRIMYGTAFTLSLRSKNKWKEGRRFVFPQLQMHPSVVTNLTLFSVAH